MLSPGLFPASVTPVCKLGQLFLLLPGLSGKSLRNISHQQQASVPRLFAELCSAAVFRPSLETRDCKLK